MTLITRREFFFIDNFNRFRCRCCRPYCVCQSCKRSLQHAGSYSSTLQDWRHYYRKAQWLSFITVFIYSTWNKKAHTADFNWYSTVMPNNLLLYWDVLRSASQSMFFFFLVFLWSNKQTMALTVVKQEKMANVKQSASKLRLSFSSFKDWNVTTKKVSSQTPLKKFWSLKRSLFSSLIIVYWDPTALLSCCLKTETADLFSPLYTGTRFLFCCLLLLMILRKRKKKMKIVAFTMYFKHLFPC